MMRFWRALLIMLGVLLITVLPVLASVPLVSSTFGADADGWTVASLNDGPPYNVVVYSSSVSWSNGGEEPRGGFIYSGDPDGITFYFAAPAKFLGDKSLAYGQQLTYDFFSSGPMASPEVPLGDWPNNQMIVLIGNGQTLVYLPGYPLGGEWGSYAVPLSEAGWHFDTMTGAQPTAEQFTAVLGDITGLFIRGEYVWGSEEARLDNVTITGPVAKPDLQIKGPNDAEYVGNDIYNDIPSQTSTTTTAGPVSYHLILGNDGEVADTFTLTGPAGEGGWTARYYLTSAVAPVEITTAVTGDGWAVALDPAETVSLRMDVFPAPAVMGNATYTATISAVSGARSDCVIAETTKQALTSVNLVGNPLSPVLQGTPVTFTATKVGGGSPEYRFVVGTYVGGVTTWPNPLPAWQTANQFVWTPTEAGAFRIIVYARELGTTPFVTSSILTYTVKPPLSAVALGITPASPKPLGTILTLTATPTGGKTVEYEFKARYLDGATPVWITIRGFNTAASCTWTPPLAKSYTLYLTAREQGAAPAQYKYAPSQTYIINAALSALALNITPTAPKALGTTLTLTGTPTGGTKVEYEFKAKYTDPVNGVTWITIQSYTLNGNTVTWTPPSARTYTLYATAREQGTATYAYAASQNYTITPVLSSVSLQVIAPWPRKVGQPITLRGNAVGGAKVEYEFKAKYVEGGVTTWVPIQAFTLGSFQLVWTPTEAHIYTVYVTAREQGSLSATWKYGAQNVSVVP